jgi:putative zinc finger/helix-turn-helix YgiT family protein
MECILCDGKTKLSKEQREIDFKKQKYLVNFSFYKCLDCGETFTDTNLDEQNISQVYNQYREKFKILFPDEIVRIREKYGLSKRKMSQILGWGDNTYGLYEKGAVSNESHSTVLEVLKDPQKFLEIVSRRVSTIISAKEYAELENKVNILIKEKDLHDICISFDELKVDQYSGYIKSNFEKLAYMIIFFILQKNSYLTRLNKLLFYSDFISYKSFKKPISGWNYAAIDKGPVIDHYKIIFGMLEENDFINSEEGFVNQNNDVIEKLVTNKDFEKSLFSDNELKVLKYVDTYFKKTKTEELISLSHKERGWKENFPSRALISYQKYADDLSIILE